jgi:Transmembrane amino acid transporter protein
MVPFFKDLVALIGALTSVPLTLLLPVVLHRRLWEMPLCHPTRHTMASYALMVFSIIYLVMGLTGSLSSIETDWTNQGRPFSCSLE